MLINAQKYHDSIDHMIDVYTVDSSKVWSAAFATPCISDEFVDTAFMHIAVKAYENINGVTVDKTIYNWLASASSNAVSSGWLIIRSYYSTMKTYYET